MRIARQQYKRYLHQNNIQDRQSSKRFSMRLTQYMRCSQTNYSLRISWIPGHMGIDSNELADYAAKQAAQSSTNLVLPTMKSARITAIKSKTKQRWLEEWKQGRDNVSESRYGNHMSLCGPPCMDLSEYCWDLIGSLIYFVGTHLIKRIALHWPLGMLRSHPHPYIVCWDFIRIYIPMSRFHSSLALNAPLSLCPYLIVSYHTSLYPHYQESLPPLPFLLIRLPSP